MSVLKGILTIVLPKWLAEDICSHFTHPYWKRENCESDSAGLTVSGGVTGKLEKFSSRRPFKRINEKSVLDLLKSNGVQDVLDVGCGVGNLVSHLDSKGFSCHGLTISPDEVKIADNERIMLFDIQENIEGSAFEGKKFDAVGSVTSFL